jgi:hypothetical protein
MISDKTDLSQDLDIAAAMATGMKDYLTGSNLFQPLSQPGMPSLTLGGYLMRAHRLDALRSQLDPADQRRLDETQATFHQALVERGPQFQQKANQELKARLRQWNEFLKDFDRAERPSAAQYQAAVEPRAMIEALMQAVDQDSRYQLDSSIASQVATLDQTLRSHWREGSFTWPQAWQSAYPAADYWWLYGQPA